MSQTNLCRLCVCICTEYQTLCDETGRCNEYYEITVKYFDAMILNIQAGLLPSSICFQCWHHISCFHNFKQSILEAQKNFLLQKDVLESYVTVKRENNCNYSLDTFVIEHVNEEQKKQQMPTDFAANHAIRVYKEYDQVSNVVNNQILTESGKLNDQRTETLLKENKEGNEDHISQSQLEFIDEISSVTYDSKVNIDESVADGDLCENINTKRSGIRQTLLKCKFCGKGFRTSQSRKLHQRVFHHNISRRVNARNLVTLDDGTMAYACNECDKVAATAAALYSHKWMVHLAKRKFRCTTCDKAYKTPFDLREHMASHSGPGFHKCSYCPTTFKYRSSMHYHIKKLHAQEKAERSAESKVASHKCSQCPKKYKSSTSLRFHQRKMHPQELDDKSIDNISYAEDDGNISHDTAEQSKKEIETADIFTENILNESICQPKLELFDVHYDSYSEGEAATSSAGNDNKLVVKAESKTFTGNDLLEPLNSNNNVISSGEANKHKCSLCDKSYKKPFDLREHMGAHMGEGVHTCLLCAKRFKYRSSMHYHMKSVHPDAGKSRRKMYTKDDVSLHKHKCTMCDKAYKVPINLREHMSTHTGEYIHNCPCCTKKFIYRSGLQSHLRTTHMEESSPIDIKEEPKRRQKLSADKTIAILPNPYKCLQCPETFRSRSTLHYHRKREHPKEWAEKHRRMRRSGAARKKLNTA